MPCRIEERAARIVEYFRMHYNTPGRPPPSQEEFDAWLAVEERLIEETRALRVKIEELLERLKDCG